MTEMKKYCQAGFVCGVWVIYLELLPKPLCDCAYWMEWVQGHGCGEWGLACLEGGGEGVALTKLTRSGILKIRELRKCFDTDSFPVNRKSYRSLIEFTGENQGNSQ